MVEECIFCKIIKGEIPSVKIWEDENYLAILDVFPNTEGMTLVLPKKHFDSYVFEMPDEEYNSFFVAGKKVAKFLEKGLNVQRVALVMEGLGVNHAHLKLYPLHGLGEKFKENLSKEIVYYDSYKGFVATHMGPKRTVEELQKVAEKIKAENNKS
jgi:diadenosine tetraphosphate (Ap4A) HIT family hydrolase